MTLVVVASLIGYMESMAVSIVYACTCVANVLLACC